MPKRNAFDALVSGSKELNKKFVKCPKCGKEINWTHSGWASHWREKHPSEKRPPLKRQRRSGNSNPSDRPPTKRIPNPKPRPKPKPKPKPKGGSRKGTIRRWHPVRWHPGRTDDWTDGKVPLWEVRILLTQWFGEAWEDLQNRPEFILHCFKSCGFYNDIGGGENHLIHCRKVSDYPSYLRAKGEPPMVPLTKEEAENQAALDRQKRSDLRKEKRKARRKKNLEKRRSVLNQQRKPWR